MSNDLRILVLGPVEIAHGEDTVAIGGRRARTVLAALVMGLRHAVSDDRLIDALWGEDPPAAAEASLQSHISRLRHHLGADTIRRSEHSYVLELDPGCIDACQFERLFNQAAEVAHEDPQAARELCREALGLWRGPAFGDLGDDDLARPEAVRLEELRIDAIELFLEATIATDHALLAVPALQAAAADHPYREKLWYLLMRALAHEGRRVEALRAYQEARSILAEVGLEPSRDLQELEQRIYAEEEPVRPHLHVPG